MKTNGNLEIELRYLAAELLYDIANCGYVVGQAIGDEGENARQLSIDVTQQGNVDRVRRSLALAFGEVQHMLYPYTKERVRGGWVCLDNIPLEEEAYTVLLSIPSDVAGVTVETLRHEIHEYLVCSALMDWLEITAPNLSAVWAAKRERSRENINRFKNFRIGRIVRTARPF